MMLTVSTRRLLVFRVLPLAAVGVLLVSLLPADFAAFADAARRPDAPVKVAGVERSVPTATPKMQLPTMGASGSTKVSLKASPIAADVRSPSPKQTVIPQTKASDPQELTPARIGDSAVNMRSGPSKSGGTVTILQAGTSVGVGETVNGWVHVYANGADGWVYSTYLSGLGSQPAQPKAAPAPQGARRAAGNLLVQSVVQVRESPGGQPIYRLEPGEHVQIAEVRGKWARIISDGGESGWVRIQ